MIRKGDVQWWVLEAKKHPESAPAIVEELAKRLAELDADNERLRDENVRLRRQPPSAAAGGVDALEALRDKVTTLQRLLDEQGIVEPSVVFLTSRLQADRLPLLEVRRLARLGQPAPGCGGGSALASGSRCSRLLMAQGRDQLLLLTSAGRACRMRLSDIPVVGAQGEWPALGTLSLAEGERLTLAQTVAQPPRFWTAVTRRGHVRQLLGTSFDRRLDRGEPVIESPLHNDPPVALVKGDEGDLLIVTRWGKAARFSHRSIAGQGSLALELEADDEVVGALSLPADGGILIATASGCAARRDSARLKARSAPGGAGRPLIQAFDVLGVLPSEPQGGLLFLTFSGKLTFVPVREVPLHERATRGAQVCDLSRDPAIAVALIAAGR